MTDKVQKIREEVEMVANRRLNLLNGDYFDLNKEVDGFTNEIMDIIDSLQEEPKPKFKVGDRICKSKIGDLKGVVINEIYSDHYMCNGACIYFTEQDDWELVEESVTKQSVEEAMQDLEEKSKAFTDAHKGESAEGILAEMKGIDPSIQDIVDKHWFEMLGEEPILEVLKKYLDHVSKEEAMKTKGAIDRWFEEYFPEPVSEELEDAADKYSQSIHSDYSNDMFDSHNIYDAVIYGANWQKERDEDEIRMIRELLDNFDKTCDEYHDAGFKHCQEALMKDAVDAKVIARWPLHSTPLYCSYEMYIPYAQHLSEGDKVKLIIIKEE